MRKIDRIFLLFVQLALMFLSVCRLVFGGAQDVTE